MGWYRKVGAFIGSHMAWIAPVCVAVGVAVPELFAPVRAWVPLLFAFITFQGALNNRFSQIAAVFRRPVFLLLLLTISTVVMPVLAYLFAMLCFAGDTNIVTGIVLEYSVPVAVVAYLWIGMYGGNRPLGLSAILVSTVLAPFTIPLTLQVLLGTVVHLDVGAMMWQMAYMIAIPAVVGMAVNDLSQRWHGRWGAGWGEKRLAPALGPASKMLLVLIITTNSTQMADYLRHPTWETLAVALFILVFAASGFVWGFLLARRSHRPVVDVVTATYVTGLRNISAGAVIAAQFFPGATVFPVMMGTMFQQVLAGLMSKHLVRLGAVPEGK